MNIKTLFKKNLIGQERRALTQVLKALKDNGLRAVLTGSTIEGDERKLDIIWYSGKEDLDLVVFGSKEQYCEAMKEINRNADLKEQRIYCLTYGLYDNFTFKGINFDVILRDNIFLTETLEDYLTRVNKGKFRAVKLI